MCRDWHQHQYGTDATRLKKRVEIQAKNTKASLDFLTEYSEQFPSHPINDASHPFSAREIVKQRLLAHAQQDGVDEKQVGEQLDSMAFHCTKVCGEERTFSFAGFSNSRTLLRESDLGSNSILKRLQETLFRGWIQETSSSDSIETKSLNLISCNKREGYFGIYLESNKSQLITPSNGRPFHQLKQGFITSLKGGKIEGTFECFISPKGILLCNHENIPFYGLRQGSITFPDGTKKEGVFRIAFDSNNKMISSNGRLSLKYTSILLLKSGARTFPSGAIFEGEFDYSYDDRGRVIRNQEGTPFLCLKKGNITLPNKSSFNVDSTTGPVFFDSMTGEILEPKPQENTRSASFLSLLKRLGL